MTKQCPKCGYAWEPKKERPKQCPFCTFKLWTREDVLADLKERAGKP